MNEIIVKLLMNEIIGFKLQDNFEKLFLNTIKKINPETYSGNAYILLKSNKPEQPFVRRRGLLRKDGVSATAEFELESGPQEKTLETCLFEEVVRALLHDPSTQIEEASYSNEVYVVCQGKPPRRLNLTVLLTKVNLSHVVFSVADIEAFEKYLQNSQPKVIQELNLAIPAFQQYIPNSQLKLKGLPEPFRSMPKGLVYAIAIYTSNTDINNLIYRKDKFRYLNDFDKIKFLILSMAFAAAGVNQLPLRYSAQLEQVTAKLVKARIINFLADLTYAGIIHASQANIISEEEQLILIDYLATRQVKRKDDMAWMVYQSGPTFFQNAGFISTEYQFDENQNNELENLSFMPSVKPISVFQECEGEVLLPGGSQVIYQPKGKKSEYFAQIVNTPVNCPISYDVAMALRHANRNHLSQHYKERSIDSEVVVNGVLIPRPNHCFVHTIRKVFYVLPIIQYFAVHASDVHMRKFCGMLQPDLLDCIQLILVFNVTGRESEISFQDNPQKYLQYRAKSCENFVNYAASNGMSKRLCDRLVRLLLNIGNPEFTTQINIPGNPDYNPEDNYLFYILSMAHDLDAMRYSNPLSYKKLMSIYEHPLVVNRSLEQSKALSSVYVYASNCIEITGDRQYTTYSKWNSFVAGEGSYSIPFDKASKDPGFCENLLRQVPTPSFLAKQLSHEDILKKVVNYRLTPEITQTEVSMGNIKLTP